MRPLNAKAAFTPEGIIFLDGSFVPAAEARVGVYDHGFMYGDGLFETMRAYNGHVFALEAHLERLWSGLAVLGFSLSDFPFSRKQIAEATLKTVALNGLSEAYVRLTITRGEGPPGLDPAVCLQPHVVIVARPIHAISPLERQVGIRLASVPVSKPSFTALDPTLKSLNYLPNILAKIHAKISGAEEGLMLAEQGYVAEGTVSNVFWIDNNGLCTPSMDTGILPGITRRLVIDAAKRLGLTVREGLFTIGHIYGAREVFLTNSGSEVIPVGWVDGRPIGDTKPGNITCRLWQNYREIVWEQIGKYHVDYE